MANFALAFGDFIAIEDRTVPFEHDNVWNYPLLKSFPNNLYAATLTYLWCKPPSTGIEISLLEPGKSGSFVCETGIWPSRPWWGLL
ncbi:MAG: hypothetical protein IMZ61_14655 [Planctomycetes bacterium]|nr:hypothetical protein [Planctomycetota bacterium]